ncbi:ATP-dependent DNA helicase [Nanoarchaeota archaeon]
MTDLFPYSKIRDQQSDMMEEIGKCVENKKNLLFHAPTGVGKTIAALAPCLSYALKNKKTVFFLTARQTQHNIAIETIRDINKESNQKICCVDMIAKNNMCLQPQVDSLNAGEFREFCRHLVEDKSCEFYTNAREKGKASVKAHNVISKLVGEGAVQIGDVISLCKNEGLCPYEVSMMVGEKANVVIADYFYMFNPSIRRIFLQKTKKELNDCIVIVDEGHNLGRRCRDLMSFKLTNFVVDRAVSEAEKYSYNVKERLEKLRGVMDKLYLRVDENAQEVVIGKNDFINEVSKICDYDQFSTELVQIGDDVREEQRFSFIGSIGSFLDNWKGADEGFTRIYSGIETSKGLMYSLLYRSLDPASVTRDVFDNVHSSIIMSGTLTPTAFYKDLLGFSEVVEKEYKSPFPTKNRLNLIIPETTTKFTRRSDEEFRNIAHICAKIIGRVPGNTAIFFPSYQIRENVYQFLSKVCVKPLIKEIQGASKEIKEEVLEKFKSYKDKGAVLMGVSMGSFGEGIDLPGDYLKCVIVVGLPLERPDLETKECIRYYEEKYGKGWDYGYIFPAITKCMQNAGRCIRSETDKGVVIFLDERYAWENYLRCFPKGWDMQITGLYEKRVGDFFNGEGN